MLLYFIFFGFSFGVAGLIRNTSATTKWIVGALFGILFVSFCMMGVAADQSGAAMMKDLMATLGGSFVAGYVIGVFSFKPSKSKSERLHRVENPKVAEYAAKCASNNPAARVERLGHSEARRRAMKATTHKDSNDEEQPEMDCEQREITRRRALVGAQNDEKQTAIATRFDYDEDAEIVRLEKQIKIAKLQKELAALQN